MTEKHSYEIIVLDLDGTLTNRDKVITPKTKQRLMELQERGKKIVLASGRPTPGVLPLASAVEKIKMDGKIVEHEVVRSTNVFMVAYVLIFAVSVLLISLDEYDLVTNFTAVTATFNNIGPGLALVGPTGNFGFFSNFSKVVLIFDMLAGRLEIFPLLLLFSRETWKRF